MNTVRPYAMMYKGRVQPSTFTSPPEAAARLEAGMKEMMEQMQAVAESYFKTVEAWLQKTMADHGLTYDDAHRCLLLTKRDEYRGEPESLTTVDWYVSDTVSLEVDGAPVGMPFVWTVRYGVDL